MEFRKPMAQFLTKYKGLIITCNTSKHIQPVFCNLYPSTYWLLLPSTVILSFQESESTSLSDFICSCFLHESKSLRMRTYFINRDYFPSHILHNEHTYFISNCTLSSPIIYSLHAYLQTSCL